MGGEGGSGESGGNVDGEGGKEQRVVGEVLVVGVAGDIKIVSQVYLYFFFLIIIIIVHIQKFLLSVFNIQGKMLFYLKGRCKRGGIPPFYTSLSSCH